MWVLKDPVTLLYLRKNTSRAIEAEAIYDADLFDTFADAVAATRYWLSKGYTFFPAKIKMELE